MLDIFSMLFYFFSNVIIASFLFSSTELSNLIISLSYILSNEVKTDIMTLWHN